MSPTIISTVTSRREMLKAAGYLAGAGLLAGWLPRTVFAAGQSASDAQAGAAQSDWIAQTRAQMGAVPLQTLKLRDKLTMLYGPGGNMVVLNGPDGKVLVDSSFLTVAPKLKKALDDLGPAPLKILINTHWHFDHTDGNAPIHAGGATIVAHENTRKRLSTPQELKVMGVRFPAAPVEAWPQQTFVDKLKLYFNSEELSLSYVPPAHTDTDILIRYEKGNVLHMGDLWFNGMYPFIDVGTGGNIDGMILAAGAGISLADADTKIVPGHGPMGDKAALIKYRDMLTLVRDRVKILKDAGKSAEESVAAKPTSDLDAAWGKGFMEPNEFVTIVYSSL
ncbi:MAG TPA: MBL fold metallo-hydrolase [Candidatus Limnocylindria bacterium]|nr:MBL fold metallo-hydrolase [Candidatus Limnocylindria bacterium]